MLLILGLIVISVIHHAIRELTMSEFQKKRRKRRRGK